MCVCVCEKAEQSQVYYWFTFATLYEDFALS